MHQIFPGTSTSIWGARCRLRMYYPSRVVEFNLSLGPLPLACARSSVMIVTFARSPKHEQLAHEYMLATVVSENIDRVDDGFLGRRFLSRKRSLEGDPKDPAGSCAGDKSDAGGFDDESTDGSDHDDSASKVS